MESMRDIFSGIEANQLMYVRKKGYLEEKGLLLLATGIYKYTVPFPQRVWPAAFNPKADFECWVKITGKDEEKRYLYVEPRAKQDKETLPSVGQPVVGVISKVNSNGVYVSISPSTYAIVSLKNMGPADIKSVRPGLLCTVVIEAKQDQKVFAKIVCTEKKDFEKGLEPMPEPPAIIFVPAAMDDALRELDLPRTDENKRRIREQFRKDYIEAFKNKEILEDGNLKFKSTAHENSRSAHYSFESSLYVERPLGNIPLIFGFKTKMDEDAYIVERCGLKTKNLHTVLERDAYAESWGKVIEDLAEMALPENWGEPEYRGKEYVKHPVLYSYFVFTYYIAKTQGRVVRKELGSDNLTIFNTGLVDNRYEYIYAVMADQTHNHSQKLDFLGFAVVGNGALGKRISKLFDELPERVQYITDANDLFLDTKAAMYDCDIDIDHIVTAERLKRLPMKFLRYICVLDDEASEILQRPESRQKWTALVDRFNAPDTNLKFRLSEEIRASKDIAVKRTEWNYKTAIPIYFAARHTLSTIIPLTLPYTDVATGRVDAALVLSHNKNSGRYQAETVLTLSMAYSNSRQIAKPDSDWLLVPKKIEEYTED